MRRYETIFIVRPNVAEDEITAITTKTNSIIESDGGTIFRVNDWGLKKLAYQINKESQGYYVYVDYAGIPAAVAEVERIFRIDDRVLKYLTVKLADFCNPEAVKEELAQAEPEPVAEEQEGQEKQEEKPEPQEEKSEAKEEKKEGNAEAEAD